MGLGSMLGMSEEEPDEEREAALAAVKRFRKAESDEEALEAFMALCDYAKGAHGAPEDED
jgi:hypothetical protein